MTKLCPPLARSRPPFLFGSMKKLAIHVLYTQQLNNCIAVETMHCCLFCSGLAVYQVQRVLITIIYCCCCTIGLLLCDECVPMPTCTSVHCKLCKVLKVCASLDCALHNCARGDFVHQCVIWSQEDLDHPDTIFASACAVAGADVYTCSGSSAVKAVPGQISSGKGSFACTFSCTFWSKKDAK